MHEQHPNETPYTIDAADYRQICEGIDETIIREAFIGTWPSRDAFGQYLLDDTGASERLQTLPTWLLPYVRLDGSAFVEELEASGFYVLANFSAGVCVFDGPTVHRHEKALVDRQIGVHNGA